jgi:hypothetical protein
MSDDLGLGALTGGTSNSQLFKKHFSHNLRPRNCSGQSCACAPDCRRRPAEAFFDSLPLSLSRGVARVPHGAAVNRAAAGPRMIVCYMRLHPTDSGPLSRSPVCQKPLSPPWSRAWFPEFAPTSAAPRPASRTVRLEHFHIDDQRRDSHQQVPGVTQLGLLSLTILIVMKGN